MRRINYGQTLQAAIMQENFQHPQHTKKYLVPQAMWFILSPVTLVTYNTSDKHVEV